MSGRWIDVAPADRVVDRQLVIVRGRAQDVGAHDDLEPGLVEPRLDVVGNRAVEPRVVDFAQSDVVDDRDDVCPESSG